MSVRTDVGGLRFRDAGAEFDRSSPLGGNPLLIQAAQEALMKSEVCGCFGETVELIEFPVSNPGGTMNWKSSGRTLKWLGPGHGLFSDLHSEAGLGAATWPIPAGTLASAARRFIAGNAAMTRTIGRPWKSAVMVRGDAVSRLGLVA